MKKKNFLGLLTLVLGLTFLASCTKDREPAVTMSGTYSGAFAGTFMEKDSLANSGYSVTVTALNDNRVEIMGNDFETFEVLVTSNGINVEQVAQNDPLLLDFIYVGAESRLKFTYNKGANEAQFIGIRQ